MTVENILDETGGFGRFQFFIVICTYLNRLTLGWSMLQMTFVGFVPEWFCASPNVSHVFNVSNTACIFNMNISSRASDGEVCDTYSFESSPWTIVSEWSLVCDMNWVTQAVISIQMAGVLLGFVTAGLLQECIGPKKTMYIFVLEHAVCNLIAAFSVNWPMFCVFRFFIGLGIGAVLETSVPYPLEFLPVKWRPLISSVPIWSLGIALLALASWLMENWSHLHFACAALSLPGVFGFFFLPESLRWLTAHEQMNEAQEIVLKIAVVNQKIQPRKASIMVQTVAWEEQKVRESSKKYTYLDIFRGWQTIRITITMCYHWFSLSLIYYGISFSVTSFAGNLYINIFLLAVVEVPVMFLTLYSDNRLGRKWTAVISLIVAFLPAIGCIVVQYAGSSDSKMPIITGFILATKLGTGAAWAVLEIWASELYPAMTRNFGLATANIAARVGAIIAPFLIDLNNIAEAAFIVVSCLLLVDIILCFAIPDVNHLGLAAAPRTTGAREESDTSGRELEDGITSDDSQDGRHSREHNGHVLETVDEETYNDELDPSTINTEVIGEASVFSGDTAISLDALDKNGKVSRKTDKKEEKSKKRKKTEAKSGKFSKKKEPQKNKESKSKTQNVDTMNDNDSIGKNSNPEPDDDVPPYIESEHNKKIRYSIY